MPRRKDVETDPPDERRNFTVGPAWCLVSLRPVAECQHCKYRLPPPAPRSTMVVTCVDHERGIVTLETK